MCAHGRALHSSTVQVMTVTGEGVVFLSQPLKTPARELGAGEEGTPVIEMYASLGLLCLCVCACAWDFVSVCACGCVCHCHISPIPKR